ncbi:MAG: response regulator transcription factor [Pirellulaceae bacterium]
MSERSLLSSRTIYVMIIEDHPLVREGLRTRISSQNDMEVTCEAESISEAMAILRKTTTLPDVAIVDIALKDCHGIELVKDIAASFPRIKILVVSAFDESVYGERALRAGALGYVNKRDAPQKILDAIRTVRDGERFLSPTMTQRLLSQAVGAKHKDARTDPVESLSDRELEVFQMIGEGMTTGMIARELFLSVHTIDTHREKIRHKLCLKNGHELMRYAIQWVLEKNGGSTLASNTNPPTDEQPALE